MNVVILGGFLGAGKTTALLQFARYLTDISDQNRNYKVAIIENEIGEVGIDDQFLRGSGYKVNNLFDGCACCTVSGELMSSIATIKDEMDPEWIIIETTGVAFPTSMQKNLEEALGYESVICVLLDASRWMRLRIPLAGMLSEQIKGSNTVLVNKIDLVEEDVVATVESDVLEIEPNTNVLSISALGEVDNSIWRTVAGLI
ncbi:MAG: cobalamin biosynthesis protein P47K [Oscillospiraceae bacterium]|nr:cobalamin biosynthesis protein P47K [Oscillospiraceae bacterium]